MRTFLLLFFLSLVLRLGTLFFFPPDQIPPNPDWETGAVSISLATSGEFADPYLVPTGPTAHMPPLFVATLSILYRVFGVGFAGGLIRWILIMVVSSVLWASMPWLSESMGMGRKVGVLGGLAGAIFLFFPSELDSVSALLLVAVVVLFHFRWRGRTEPDASTKRAFLSGIALGAAFHFQPVLLPVVLGCMAFEVWRWPRKGTWHRSGLMALGMFLACVPWGIRNYNTFHQVYFIRSNLGLELYVGNHEGAHADIDVSSARRSFRHPRTDPIEAERVLEIGEGPYMAEKRQEAVDWIRSNPREFLRLSGTRFLYFWLGPLHRLPRAAPYLFLTLLAVVGAWRVLPTLDVPGRAALLIPLATYPLIYYLLAYMPRYGEPIRWILFLLAGAAILGPDRAQGKRRDP